MQLALPYNEPDYFTCNPISRHGTGYTYTWLVIQKETCKLNSIFPKPVYKKLISGHLNFNGLRNNHFEFHLVLTENLLPIFFISETKLDSYFPNAQFQVPCSKHYWIDRNAHGGGTAACIRSYLPHRRRPDFDSVVIAPVEAFVIDVKIQNKVWLYICMAHISNIKWLAVAVLMQLSMLVSPNDLQIFLCLVIWILIVSVKMNPAAWRMLWMPLAYTISLIPPHFTSLSTLLSLMSSSHFKDVESLVLVHPCAKVMTLFFGYQRVNLGFALIWNSSNKVLFIHLLNEFGLYQKSPIDKPRVITVPDCFTIKVSCVMMVHTIQY